MQLFLDRSILWITALIEPFVWVFLMIVELFGTVFVAYVTIALRLRRGVLWTIAEKGKVTLCL